MPSLLIVLLAPFLSADAEPQQQLQRKFQEAIQLFDSNHLAEAASRLEQLVREAPRNFDVHELLGMVYAAQGKDVEANEHLQKAVRLKPGSAAAHTNLATNLVRLRRLALAETEFKKALALDAASYETNHNLGELYLASGRLALAIPFLEKAQQIHPGAYDNGYDLSLSYLQTGKTANARNIVERLLKQKNTAELHNLLAQIEEKDDKFLVAEHEYETAARMDPSESNLFDWASELLLHRTLDPAIEVFRHAGERYPQSPRLSIGLGMALYSRGNYDDAVKALLRAADLNPSDPRCYFFLSKAYDSSPSQADEVIERFRRFYQLEPQNARAPFYYAMSLWKGRRAQDASFDANHLESLLHKATRLDPSFADAHLQLGNLYSDQGKYADAIVEYERAVQLNADLADAHYRLGQAYVRTGKKDLAQPQLEIYQKLRTQHMAELDRQRAEIQQFVYSEKNAVGSKPQ